jgi:hypothetical protein
LALFSLRIPTATPWNSCSAIVGSRQKFSDRQRSPPQYCHVVDSLPDSDTKAAVGIRVEPVHSSRLSQKATCSALASIVHFDSKMSIRVEAASVFGNLTNIKLCDVGIVSIFMIDPLGHSQRQPKCRHHDYAAWQAKIAPPRQWHHPSGRRASVSETHSAGVWAGPVRLAADIPSLASFVRPVCRNAATMATIGAPAKSRFAAPRADQRGKPAKWVLAAD